MSYDTKQWVQVGRCRLKKEKGRNWFTNKVAY